MAETKEKVDATEGAEALAKSEKVDLSEVKGTGAEGRVIKDDVEKFLRAQREEEDTDDEESDEATDEAEDEDEEEDEDGAEDTAPAPTMATAEPNTVTKEVDGEEEDVVEGSPQDRSAVPGQLQSEGPYPSELAPPPESALQPGGGPASEKPEAQPIAMGVPDLRKSDVMGEGDEELQIIVAGGTWVRLGHGDNIPEHLRGHIAAVYDAPRQIRTPDESTFAPRVHDYQPEDTLFLVRTRDEFGAQLQLTRADFDEVYYNGPPSGR